MGCIYQRGRTWWIKYSRAGRAFYESSGSTKHAEAKRLLKLREGDSERGVPITPKVGRVRFDEAAADLITEYRNNGRKSLEHLERRLRKHLTPVFSGRRMALITTADARKYIDSRQATGASHGEINRELAILKRMYALAQQGGKLLIRPHIPMLKEQNVRTGFFEREELDAVHAYLPAPLRPMAVFAYLTGWRVPSEVQTLEWRQVDFKAGTARLDVGTTKNEAARTFPFDVLPELCDLLEEQAAVTKAVEQRQGRIVRRVFHRDGRPIKTSDVRGRQRARQPGAPDASRTTSAARP